MTRILAALLLVFACSTGLTGCVSVGQGLAELGASVSNETPTQVTTLAEAYQAARLITIAATTAVDTGKLNEATLLGLQNVRGAVRAALDTLNDAHMRGENLNFAAIDAALTAYRAYTTAKGIPVVSKGTAP